MGLTESKVPFEEDAGSETPKTEKEIGVCAMWDPRSPSNDFERTPVFDRIERVKIRDQEDIGAVVGDPRSPSNEITRTPVTDENKKSSTDNIYSELRAQLERLQIYDGSGIHNTTASSENLGNDSESINAVAQQKSVLKLLDEESSPKNTDSLCSLPSTPPCPKSRSTPRQLTPNSPDTPGSAFRGETDELIKRRKPLSKKQRSSQNEDKLQRKVLKKALLGEQATRSPLGERNGPVVKDGRAGVNGKMKNKSNAFVKYRKYNSLDESFNDSFSGKENEQINVW
ncbi:uncharacterized protein LOC114518331 [Dendronephthya gigantea]|uniref:uncharacterized protein LOC114518331 n=1 Tax=Dendronephthya gigantea TaxID=151771 RepID=UPI00106C623F|nr:uncharacterized protein LOC114518331 [Dendronephthya gigantea]